KGDAAHGFGIDEIIGEAGAQPLQLLFAQVVAVMCPPDVVKGSRGGLARRGVRLWGLCGGAPPPLPRRPGAGPPGGAPKTKPPCQPPDAFARVSCHASVFASLSEN